MAVLACLAHHLPLDTLPSESGLERECIIMDKETILLTGGAGFVGSHVARDLLRFYGSEYRIIVVDDLSGGFVENLPEGAEFVCADVSDQRIVRAIFKVKSIIEQTGFTVKGFTPAGLKGKKGNQEYFFLLVYGNKNAISDTIIDDEIKI